MATFLDVTGLAYFSSIFVFLFVWLVVYATFLWTKLLGENHFVIAIAGLLIGIFVLMSPLATNVIANVAPFLAVVFVLILLLNMTSRMLGTDIGSFQAVKGVFLVVILMIIIISVAVKIRDEAQIDTQKDLSKTMNLIFHPKVLGSVLIFAISIFTIALLASRSI